jgi:hypothetical protein
MNRLNPSRTSSPNAAPDGAIVSGSFDSAASADLTSLPVSYPASSRHLLPQCLYHPESGYASPLREQLFSASALHHNSSPSWPSCGAFFLMRSGSPSREDGFLNSVP